MGKTAREKGSHFFEWEFKRKDGKKFFAAVLLTGMELDNEIFLQSTIRDITEKKMTEESLKKFKTISDNQTIGNAIADSNLNLVYHNKAFAEMHGYKDGEMIGRNLSEFLPEEELRKKNRINRVSVWLEKNKGCYYDEVWHAKKRGGIFPTLTNVSEIRNEKGEPLFWATSVIEISKRKKAEEALQKREKELKLKAASLVKSNTALEVLLREKGGR